MTTSRLLVAAAFAAFVILAVLAFLVDTIAINRLLGVLGIGLALWTLSVLAG